VLCAPPRQGARPGAGLLVALRDLADQPSEGIISIIHAHWDLCPSPLDLEQREGRIQRFGGLSVRSALAQQLRQRTLDEAGRDTSPWAILAAHAEQEFSRDESGRSPWWSCPDEKIDRLFVVLPQSRQTARFDQLSRLRWVYRLALGQPHQQDFIETVSQLPDDGRQRYALRLSAWREAR
jgi:hypothetical protein